MQKINLALTLMHGEKVARWVKNVSAALDELNPDTHDVDELWMTFLEEFAQQYTDTQAAERARVALKSLRMKAQKSMNTSQNSKNCATRQVTRWAILKSLIYSSKASQSLSWKML